YVGVVGIVAVTTLATVSLTTWNTVAYTNYGLVLPLAGGLTMAMLIAALNLAVGYFIEGRSRRAMIGLFGQYVAPQLVERMAGDPTRHVGIDSQNKELTILFADIRGFTRIAESMDPQQLREYLNRFLTAMTEVIYAYNGTVDKYMGDAVMAFWGAPIEDAAHADHAVAAALAMQDEVARLNAEFQLIGLPPLAVGIGINTGVVRVGDMGSRLRRAYTAIGDAVNLASRLEGLSKTLEVPIVVGEATRAAVRSVTLEFVAETEVAGRVERVRVYTPARAIGWLPAARPGAATPVAERVA
ncbi:MAG TPA: adenylate/guanylate cyclase domain-containing protein, partial [Burkholderiaceae bacterium]|nr:adenylate/guanylate cyclase domain-containing protein [Burkholderiaceae bacterium]